MEMTEWQTDPAAIMVIFIDSIRLVHVKMLFGDVFNGHKQTVRAKKACRWDFIVRREPSQKVSGFQCLY